MKRKIKIVLQNSENTLRTLRSGKVITTTEKPPASSDLHTPRKKKVKTEQLPPRTPGQNTPTNLIISNAKSAFRRCATPKRLVGRDDERLALNSFWSDHVSNRSSGALYISGCPGTGKTALLTEVLRSVESDCNVLISKTNCMTLNDPKAIYNILLRAFTKIKGGSMPENPIEALDNVFINQDVDADSLFYVVILDEIDHLITADKDVLYKLFEWPTLPHSRLVVIGIANALDLTKRFLPRLRAQKCEPVLLNFNPYKMQEITAIITERLASAADRDSNNALIMESSAIEFCARKIVGTGDLRKALDVCRQAIETMEYELKMTPKKHDSPAPASTPPPPVTIAHVSKVTKMALGCHNDGVTKIKELNFQQKTVLICAMFLMRSRKADHTLGKLQSMYSRICSDKKYSLPPALSRNEFNDLAGMLQTLGLIDIGFGNEERERRIVLTAHHQEIHDGVGDIRMLRSILEANPIV